MNFDFEYLVNLMVNQSLINKENNWKQLPPDQQQALVEMLDAVHTLQENNAKIRPEYKQQVLDALILKAAEEIGIYRGNSIN